MTYTQLIEFFGSQSKVARAISISPVSVCLWQKSGVPDKRQLQFEQLTEGALKADPEIVSKYRALLPTAAA